MVVASCLKWKSSINSVMVGERGWYVRQYGGLHREERTVWNVLKLKGRRVEKIFKRGHAG